MIDETALNKEIFWESIEILRKNISPLQKKIIKMKLERKAANEMVAVLGIGKQEIYMNLCKVKDAFCHIIAETSKKCYK